MSINQDKIRLSNGHDVTDVQDGHVGFTVHLIETQNIHDIRQVQPRVWDCKKKTFVGFFVPLLVSLFDLRRSRIKHRDGMQVLIRS